MTSAISFVSVPDFDGPEGARKTISYEAFVALLFKTETFRHMVDHARGGVCEEAGELSTCLKRHVVYKKDLDRKNLVEELGDLRFFMQAVMNLFDVDEQEILQANAEKLSARYKSFSYSQEAAWLRADKPSGE